NVCRHRGTRLCEEPEGRFSETIQCPYHAWTYTIDGQLIGAPHMNEVPGFDKGDYPLHAVPLETWEGFAFVNLAREPQAFAQAFTPLAGRFSRFNLPALKSARRIDYDVAANWKLVFQNYSECLHCPVIHPGLAKLTPYTSGANDLFDGPFLGGYMIITKEGGSLTLSGRACGAPVGVLPAEDRHRVYFYSLFSYMLLLILLDYVMFHTLWPGGTCTPRVQLSGRSSVAPIGVMPAEDRHRVYFYSLFPNLLLSLHPDYVMFHTLWPEGPGQTRISCEWLFHPDSFGQPGFDPDDAVRFWDE